jgi:hypothetical protein
MRNASQGAGKAGATSSAPVVSPHRADFTRRRFLFALTAGGAGAAAAKASPALAASTGDATSAPAAATSGYRETAHVRDYYDSTRI